MAGLFSLVMEMGPNWSLRCTAKLLRAVLANDKERQADFVKTSLCAAMLRPSKEKTL